MLFRLSMEDRDAEGCLVLFVSGIARDARASTPAGEFFRTTQC